MRLSFGFALLLAACGGGGAAHDGSTTHDSGASGAACSDDTGCGPKEQCAYKIADGCNAKGECVTAPTFTCESVELLCGCNGNTVTGGCAYPSGYASGPSNGESLAQCTDGGGL